MLLKTNNFIELAISAANWPRRKFVLRAPCSQKVWIRHLGVVRFWCSFVPWKMFNNAMTQFSQILLIILIKKRHYLYIQALWCHSIIWCLLWDSQTSESLKTKEPYLWSTWRLLANQRAAGSFEECLPPENVVTCLSCFSEWGSLDFDREICNWSHG